MSGTDPVITLAVIIKMEMPDGDVRICEGGMVEFAGERYESLHPVFGALHSIGEVDSGFGDMAESATVVLAPNPEAAVSSWWRRDLKGARVRSWIGEIDADGFTVTGETQLVDLLIDSYERQRGDGGQELLPLDFIGRTEKLFLINQGNVCSSRFHQSVWAGERGFDNATDLQGYVTWGVASPPRGTSGGGGGGGGGGRGPFGGVFDR